MGASDLDGPGDSAGDPLPGDRVPGAGVPDGAEPVRADQDGQHPVKKKKGKGGKIKVPPGSLGNLRDPRPEYPAPGQVMFAIPTTDKEEELFITLSIKVPTFGRPSQATREAVSMIKVLALHGHTSDSDILVSVTNHKDAPVVHRMGDVPAPKVDWRA